ncbi:MAG: A/G-specific adenine glycosylase [Clostridia bacterium]|nr:A/G-specific adenine glycosylase [Clostridia bacterium]
MRKNEILQKLPSLLLPWFDAHHRDLPWRKNKDPYRVWISEIMLQQTRVEAVVGYYDRFLTALPDVRALANVQETELFKLWEGLGYYSRARNLQKAARAIEDAGGAFPSDYDGVRALPGIGDYTAGAICSICFEMPTPAVDGNVLRVYTRLLCDERPIDTDRMKAAVKDDLAPVYPSGSCGQFTQSLMELGAILCTPKSPHCDVCPLAAVCLARGAGRQSELPKKGEKRARRVEERMVLRILCDGDLALCRRENKGLLAGLWQLPNELCTPSPAAALAFCEAHGMKPKTIRRELHRTHVFTHIEWKMTCYEIEVEARGGDFVFASAEELDKVYALPTAFRIFCEDI